MPPALASWTTWPRASAPPAAATPGGAAPDAVPRSARPIAAVDSAVEAEGFTGPATPPGDRRPASRRRTSSPKVEAVAVAAELRDADQLAEGQLHLVGVDPLALVLGAQV